MKSGRRNGKPLQFAAARAALWFLNDVPAHVEALLFPNNVRMPVPAMLLCLMVAYCEPGQQCTVGFVEEQD